MGWPRSLCLTKLLRNNFVTTNDAKYRRLEVLVLAEATATCFPLPCSASCRNEHWFCINGFLVLIIKSWFRLHRRDSKSPPHFYFILCFSCFLIVNVTFKKKYCCRVICLQKILYWHLENTNHVWILNWNPSDTEIWSFNGRNEVNIIRNVLKIQVVFSASG